VTRSAFQPEPYGYRRDAAVPAFDDSSPIIIFDGMCMLCSGFAQFVLKHDRRRRLRLLAAQTPLGAALYDHFGLERTTYETYVLLENGRALLKSDAALRILSLMGLPWSLANAGSIAPRFLRHAFYDFIARNRLRWFGVRETCFAPSAEDAGRFVQ
jgi:predicted DCC family thiol-disulfide oxidoreductase YuxK